MLERDVFRLLMARRDSYDVTNVVPIQGRTYSMSMNGRDYNAVVLIHSFQYYELRYHIADIAPELVVCYVHDSVLPIPVLSLRVGNFAQPYELPENITDIPSQRTTKTGSQVLLGQYISGVRAAQEYIKDLPVTTRKRYQARARMLAKRQRGKPVNHQEKEKA
jgi:hypothetical protein